LKSDRKRNKERVGGCFVSGAWNHVKENTSISQLVSKPPITDIKILFIRYIRLYV
jgi:hypothetical protein